MEQNLFHIQEWHMKEYHWEISWYRPMTLESAQKWENMALPCELHNNTSVNDNT